MTNDEIRAAMERGGVTQADLARLLSLTPGKVSLSLNGKRRWAVAEMDALRGILRGAETSDGAPAPRAIPIIGQVQAGNWREAVARSGSSIPAPDPSLPPMVFALRVAGDSMDAYVRDGGVAMVDPDDKSLFAGRLYVILRDDGEATFKRYETDPARLEPCSSNPEHQAIELGAGPVTIVGRVVWIAYRP